MAKIKVIIASNIMSLGGAERTVQTLALYLDKTLFDVTVLCLEGGGGRVDILVRSGIKVLIGNGTLQKIKELIPVPDVDVLHFHRSGHTELLHNEVVDYLCPKKIMETNVFAFSDHSLESRFDLQVYKSMMMLVERVWKGKVPSADAWFKQRVIYNPVTVDYFKQYKLNSEQVRNERLKWGISDKDILVGRIGRNDVVKWGDLILAALPYLFAKFPQLKFLFRTIPDSRLAWLKNCGYLDRVVVLPETKDEAEIAATYQMLDMYVHTSRRGEAFGNTLNEAMVWSLPIVVENTPHWDNGQVEQVDHGKTGWIVQSVGGLVEAMSDLINHPERRTQFGVAGYEKVFNSFNLKIGIAQYQLAYMQLAEQVQNEQVMKEIFPTTNQIANFHKEYMQLKKIDMIHHNTVWLNIVYLFRKMKWRLGDSLRARGLFK